MGWSSLACGIHIVYRADLLNQVAQVFVQQNLVEFRPPDRLGQHKLGDPFEYSGQRSYCDASDTFGKTQGISSESSASGRNAGQMQVAVGTVGRVVLNGKEAAAGGAPPSGIQHRSFHDRKEKFEFNSKRGGRLRFQLITAE